MGRRTTFIQHPQRSDDDSVKSFQFDFSYWSHDGFQYIATQSLIFNDLGSDILQNAWLGYNSSLFAYGQTGSGKSYSVMGHGVNKGLIPNCCEELFKQIQNRNNLKNAAGSECDDANTDVKMSMLEIYNERVYDLLSTDQSTDRYLKVREDRNKGFFVENLTVVVVTCYAEMERWIEEGNKMRTIAATKMNDASSRAHTITTIQLTQNFLRTKKTLRSDISLVDLAGSERQKQTETTGDRFKESKNINQSLATLGNVIHDLVELTTKKKKIAVRYRDSVLTQLLKNTLGGNSRTVMLPSVQMPKTTNRHYQPSDMVHSFINFFIINFN
ncbi:hypothetical protein HELRODRAFT_102359 [Helobdella robusta]|uniref:Kinesin motor domain-containing protein n=1 Tax=Helobdella robusta TaxID=6412 RepID=T1ED97_HELRO|nr:hypothetical protein HELRODRAFT_102359 [Helobdella robusta]ESN96977.1 hypothetical protein HELRODRAFT_102359 [Helobdella robusta]